MILGESKHNEAALANWLFSQIEEPDERRRIAILFLQMLEATGELPAQSWADQEPDGNRKAPNLYNVFGHTNGRT